MKGRWRADVPAEIIAALNAGEQLPDWWFTPARKRSVQLKREYDEAFIKGCLSGHELVTAFQSGRAKPYRLDRPGVGICYPKTARIDTRALWRLRGVYMLALEWIAYAMLHRKRRGLCASYVELGVVCGVTKDRMYQVIRDLRAWKLVHSGPSFPRYGKASNQRASGYRLTNVAANAFGLPHADSYVDPQDVKPIAKRAKGRAFSEKTTTHPEPQGVLNPETGGSPNAHSPGAVSAAPTQIDFRTSAMNDSSDASQPDGQDASTGLSSQLFELERRGAPGEPASSGRELEAVARPVGDVVRDRPSGRSEPGREEDRARIRHENDIRRQGRLREQLDRLEERERRRVPVEPAAPSLPADDHLEALRRERERLEEERRGRQNVPLVKRPPPVDDLADTIERAIRSSRRGAEPTPYELLALAKMRRGGSDGSGGAS